MNVKTMSVAAMTTLIMSGAALTPAFAQTTQQGRGEFQGPMQGQGGARTGRGTQGQHEGMMERPAVFGTVQSVSGTSISLLGKTMSAAATTTYTIDASDARIDKQGVQGTTTVSSISVGDTLMVMGTISGTSVTARTIRDGAMGGQREDMMDGRPGSSTSDRTMDGSFHGNGQPVVGGTISSISGNTITITNEGGSTFTVDATNATVMKEGATSTVSTLASGDSIIVQGTVNGSSVTATSIVDQGVHVTQTDTQEQQPSQDQHSAPIRMLGGMMSGIGSFFGRLFGF